MRTLFLSLFALILAACSSNPVVEINTDKGTIVIEVYEDKAPKSAADFLIYVDEGRYDGQGFYRAVTAASDQKNMGMEIVQGGRYDLVRRTEFVPHESTAQTGLTHHDGAVSIARDAPGTGNAAYFFISVGDNKMLDAGGNRTPDGEGFAVFGQVTKGMDVVRAIQAGQTRPQGNGVLPPNQLLTEPVTILSAKRK